MSIYIISLICIIFIIGSSKKKKICHTKSPSQLSFAPQLSNKQKVSFPSGSMEEILGELEENASSPCQIPLSPKVNNNGEYLNFILYVIVF